MSLNVWTSTLIVDQNRILLVREKKEKVYEKINFLGGRLELGETVIEWAIREVSEEVQCEIVIDGLLRIHNSKKHGTLYHIFTGHIIDGVGEANPNEVLDARWYTFEELEDLPDNLFLDAPKMRDAIRQYQIGNVTPIDLISCEN